MDYSAQEGTQLFHFLTLLYEAIDMVKRSSQKSRNCTHKLLSLKPYLYLSKNSKQDLDGRIVELKQKNKDSEKTIAKLQQKNEESEKILQQKIKEYTRDTKSIKDLEETVENLRCNLASKYQDKQRFESAAQQYRALKHLKNEQQNRLSKNKSGTDQAVHEAKAAELKYSHKYRQTLIQAKDYYGAEAELERLLKRRQDFFPNSGSLKETRELHFELCKALRCQKSTQALAKAERLYGDRANLESRDAQKVDDRDFAFRNV